MIIQVNIGGTDVSSDILYNSVRVKFLTEDDEHFFGVNSVSLSLDNINGVRNDMLLVEGRTGFVTLLNRKLLDVVVETVSENKDEETIEITLMSADRKALDQLKTLKIINYRQDYQGLWTLFEGAAQYRVWTRVDKILERALASIGLDLNWDIRQLGTSHLMMGGLSPGVAEGVAAPPEVIADLPIIGKIYHPRKPILPDWDVATLLAEVSQLFNAYWRVIDGTLHIKDLSRWQDLSSAGVVLPLIQGTLGSEYGEAQLARVELSFKSAMPAPRQAPARTSDALDYLNGGSDVKKLESKFALPYALVYDYIGAATAGIAVVPKDVEENYFLMVTDGDLWYQQRAEGASWYLSSYETALHEIGTAKGTVSVMDDPDLVVDLSSPYVRLAIPNLNGNVVCLKEATLNPHEESMEISAGIYSGLNA